VDIVDIGLIALSVVLVLGGGGVAIAAARPYHRELDDWRDAGLITAEQATALKARRQETLERERRERGAKALAILGAAACAAGIVLFFAANWGEIPRPLRLLILIAGIAALYSAGFWLLEIRRAYYNVGQGFVFMGAVLFGVSLFLVGQMYNVDSHDPLGFLLWAAGGLATALFFRCKPAAGLFALALEAWIVHELVDYDSGYDEEVFIPYVLALYGLGLYALGTAGAPWLDRFRLAGAFRVVGFAIAAIMVFALSFRYTHLTSDKRPHDLTLWVILVSAAFAAVGAAVLLARPRAPWRRLEAVLAAAATGLVLLAVFVPENTRDRGFFETDARVYPLLFTAVVILAAAGAILAGSLLDELWLSSAGISLGALAIVGHVADNTWDRLPRSAVFLCVGLLALLTAAAFARVGRFRTPRTA
jgi:uncharacterized membrane protein